MNLKNPIIFILFIFIITSCKSKFDSNKFYVNNNLLSIDTNIINNNEESILKLLDINYNDLNDYNKQYYNLLKIIGQNRNYTKIKSDSSIKGVYNYFEGLERKNKFDKYNFGRSSILYGLIKANLNSSATTIYPLIKQGQDY